MPRLFVALPVPEQPRRTLGLIAGGLPGARWLPPESLHITLGFIGEVDNRVADDVADALGGVHALSFEIEVKGLGAFGDTRSARQLYATVVPTPELAQLESRIKNALARVPGINLQHRRTIPHITLARFAKPNPAHLKEILEGNGLLSAGPWDADWFGLYSSHIHHGHIAPDYQIEQRYDFLGI